MLRFRCAWLWCLVALVAGCQLPGPTGVPVAPVRFTSDTPFEAVCALWVTRWDYRTEADVERIVADAADLGVTDLVFQVRGQADAFYRSEIEPWGRELLAEGVDDPGFDPLATVCAAAHARGLRVHAWINVMPLWRTTQEPADPQHLYHTRPEWRLYDAEGHAQPLNDHYVVVNPVLPQVHDYLCGIARDIVSRYPVDGLHLDYIRFVAERIDDAKLYPGDEQSLAMFRQLTGREATEDREGYRQFIRQRITELVRAIRTTVKAARPDATLSAAIWRDHRVGNDRYLQDAVTWMREGLIDAAMPMIYTKDNALFEKNLGDLLAVRQATCLLAGVGVYMHDSAELTRRQLTIAREMGANGLCLFSYHGLFDSQSHEQPRSDAASQLRRERREAVRVFLAGLRNASAAVEAEGDAS